MRLDKGLSIPLLLLAMFFAFLLVGCNLDNAPSQHAAEKPSATTSPVIPPSETSVTMEGSFTELPPNVGVLVSITNKGNLLVMLWNDQSLDGKPYIENNIYEYDVMAKTITYLVGPSAADFAISGVSRFDDWLLWVESPDGKIGMGWKLHLTNLAIGEDSILAQDDLNLDPDSGVMVNLRPLSPSINQSYVTWSQYTRNGDTFDSQIFLYDLKTREKRSIAKIERSGFDSQLVSPRLSGETIVWNKFVRSKNNVFPKNDVFLMDIKTGQEQRLTESGNCIGSVISNNYVVWEYRNTDEGVYGQIELFDLNTKVTTRITRGGPTAENWSPSIGSRFVAWQSSVANKLEVFDLQSKTLRVLDTGQIGSVLTNGNTVAWGWSGPTPVSGTAINPSGRRLRFVQFPETK